MGYDHIDAKWAGEHGIIVTNTPEVLNEEVADTALGLLALHGARISSGRTLFCAPENGRRDNIRSPKRRCAIAPSAWSAWAASARRSRGGSTPSACRSSITAANRKHGVSYKYYPKLLDMARDVDTLMVIVPGGASTQNMINADVLKALGPQGVLINMARGSVVDEPALIEALKNRTIYSAGLDVFAKEPQVPKELIEMDHIVLFPHLGSSTEVTRAAMDQLVVDNILAWAAGKPPLTPVSETPWPPKR